MLKLNNIILFYYKNKNYKNNNDYKNISTKKLITNYKVFKKFYFILFYSDLVVIDSNFSKDLISNTKKVQKYLELNKKNLLYFYYNKNIYNYSKLFKLIKFNNFNYKTFYYFMFLKNYNLNYLKILLYIKKKKCQQ